MSTSTSTSDPPRLSIDSSSLDPAANPRPTKRRRRSIVPPPPQYEDAPAVLPSEMVASLLNRSTAMILQSLGFDGATSVAQERLRQLAEDYYLQMLHTIQLFTHAQRRTRPTVLDFQDMLTHTHIPLSDLEHELHRLPSKTHLLLPRSPSPPASAEPDLSALLGPQLLRRGKRKRGVNDHLPPFPSRHTYMSTPVFTSRPTEPRLIRERATEEARLAENALRKLLAVSAASRVEMGLGGAEVGVKRKERDEAWRRAWEGLNPQGVRVNGTGETQGETEGGKEEGYLEVIVNAETQYWRKGAANGKRKRTAVAAGV